MTVPGFRAIRRIATGAVALDAPQTCGGWACDDLLARRRSRPRLLAARGPRGPKGSQGVGTRQLETATVNLMVRCRNDAASWAPSGFQMALAGLIGKRTLNIGTCARTPCIFPRGR